MGSIEAMDCEGQVEILEIPKTLEKNLIVMFQSEDFQLLLLNNVGFVIMFGLVNNKSSQHESIKKFIQKKLN